MSQLPEAELCHVTPVAEGGLDGSASGTGGAQVWCVAIEPVCQVPLPPAACTGTQAGCDVGERAGDPTRVLTMTPSTLTLNLVPCTPCPAHVHPGAPRSCVAHPAAGTSGSSG